MNRNIQIRNSLLLVLTALIWGASFVAQSKGGDTVGPFTFNGVRSIMGGLVLLPVIAFMDRRRMNTEAAKKEDRRSLYIGGVCCGTALFLATSFQQMGIYLGTPAGKAGFLTACYIVFVSVIGMFIGKKSGPAIWIGMLITVVGLYLLCITKNTGFASSDVLELICAVIFAVHILIIDHFSPMVDGVRMSCLQFFVCGILSLIPMFIVDMRHSAAGFIDTISVLMTAAAWPPILYAGVMSCGVAYTLQIIGQKGLNPTIASMLMSLESVFSVLAGRLLLGERLSVRQLTGCILIFMAVTLAQLPWAHKRS